MKPPLTSHTHPSIVSLASEQPLHILFSEEHRNAFQIGLLVFNGLELPTFNHRIQRRATNLEPLQDLFGFQQCLCHPCISFIFLSICTSFTKYTMLSKAWQGHLDVSLYICYTVYIVYSVYSSMYESEAIA